MAAIPVLMRMKDSLPPLYPGPERPEQPHSKQGERLQACRSDRVARRETIRREATEDGGRCRDSTQTVCEMTAGIVMQEGPRSFNDSELGRSTCREASDSLWGAPAAR